MPLVPAEWQETLEPLGKRELLVPLELPAFQEAKVPQGHLETPAVLEPQVVKELLDPLVV